MKRWWHLLPLLGAVACSNLEEGEGGVAALEIRLPEDPTLEVGQQVQLSAQALDAAGEVVSATIEWRASSEVLSVDANGLVTGVEPGAGDVQAVVGSLASERVGFSILTPADTLILVGDSVLVIPAAADPPVSTTLEVRLESREPPGPAGFRPVVFEILRPASGAPPVVQLTGGVQIDTVTTTTEGAAVIALSLVAGQAAPDTVIVEVRASRAQGAVPGSGQRFIALFQ